MRATGLIVKALAVLGFGGAAGLMTGCANRASKSRSTGDNPPADTVVVRDVDAPVQAMYGVPPARFDDNKERPVRRAVPGQQNR